MKFVFKYDRNTVVNILKKQGVPAPWVIIHLLYHSSHILRTTERMIILICEFHCTLRLKIHFLWQKYSTEINKTEWSWRHSFRITHEHDENGTSLNWWDKAHAFFEQQEEWISLLVMVLFSAMFSYFILDSFEPEKMVCLTKNGATFSSLNLSRRTYCSSYDEHACQTIIFSSCRKLKNQSLKLIVIAFCKKCPNCHRVIKRVPGDMSSQARW